MTPSQPTARATVLKKARALVDGAWNDTKLFETNYRQAQKLLQAALIAAPDDISLLTCLGAVLSDQGFHTKAVELLRKAVALGSRDGNTYYNLAVARINVSPAAAFKRLFALSEQYPRRPETWEAYFDPQGR
jgi:predicted Zn-dependent protease